MIRPLTSLRFLFAFMVFCCHARFYNDPSSFGYKLFYGAMAEGYIGVSFFFILSGFILSVNYAESFQNDGISARDFWLLRFARIYPLYLATLLLEIPFTMHLYHASAGEWWGLFFINVAMLQSWVPETHWTISFNIPAWSVSAEALFYALFPWLVVRIGTLGRGLFLGLGAMVVIIIGMCFTPENWPMGMLYNNPFGRLAEFVLGITIYRYYERYSSKSWSYAYGTLMEIAAVLLFILVFIPHNLVMPRLRSSVYYWPSMIFLIYVFARAKGALSKLLSMPVMVFLGEISFAFYLIHFRLGGLLNGANRRFLHMDQASPAYFLLYFFIAIGISAVVYLFFERPANQYLRRRLLQAPANPALPSGPAK